MALQAFWKDLFKHSSEFNSRVSKLFFFLKNNAQSLRMHRLILGVFSGYTLITYGNYTDVEGCPQTPRKRFRDMGLWHLDLKILLKDWGAPAKGFEEPSSCKQSVTEAIQIHAPCVDWAGQSQAQFLEKRLLGLWASSFRAFLSFGQFFFSHFSIQSLQLHLSLFLLEAVSP